MKTYQFNLRRKFINTVFWIGMCTGYGFACQVLADEISNTANQRFEQWERASDTELDQLRGGFLLPNGMNVDFSLARTTSLNGAVVSSSYLQLPDNVSLFQNGNMNQTPYLAMSGLGSVIQNNLDNQVIRTVTDINMAVSHINNLGLKNNRIFFNDFILPNAH